MKYLYKIITTNFDTFGRKTESVIYAYSKNKNIESDDDELTEDDCEGYYLDFTIYENLGEITDEEINLLENKFGIISKSVF